MGSIYKKSFTKPLPDGAEIVSRKGERIAKWKTKDGKRRTGRVTGKEGNRVLMESATYTAKYRDAQGRVIEKATGCRDESAARQLLAEWVRRTEQIRAGVFTPGEDAIADHSRTGLDGHIEAYLDFLNAKGTTQAHRKAASQRLRTIFDDCAFGNLRDLERSAFEKWLSLRASKGVAARTRNAYREALVAFANWAVANNRLSINPFSAIPKANQTADPRRQRRALTEDELTRLLDATARRPLLEAMIVRRGEKKGETSSKLREETQRRLFRLGWERQLIYKTLALTGLRKSELASITLAQTELDGPSACLRLSAPDAKNRQSAQIPLRGDLAKDVGEWLADRLDTLRGEAVGHGEPLPARLPDGAPLFNVPKGLVKIFDRDLKLAGIAKRDGRGRTVDVHALRVSFGSHLSKGGVPLRTAQAALRHSDPKLTANVYTDPILLDIAGALDSLPELPLTGPRAQREAKAANQESSSPLAPTLAPTPVQTSKSGSIAGNNRDSRQGQRNANNPLESITKPPYNAPSIADSNIDTPRGAVAQLGERMSGRHEVRGSIPLSSTMYNVQAESS